MKTKKPVLVFWDLGRLTGKKSSSVVRGPGTAGRGKARVLESEGTRAACPSLACPSRGSRWELSRDGGRGRPGTGPRWRPWCGSRPPSTLTAVGQGPRLCPGCVGDGPHCRPQGRCLWAAADLCVRPLCGPQGQAGLRRGVLTEDLAPTGWAWLGLWAHDQTGPEETSVSPEVCCRAARWGRCCPGWVYGHCREPR